MSSISSSSNLKTLNGVVPVAGNIALISSDNSVTFTPGVGQLDVKATGSGGAGITTIDTDSGSVTATSVTLTGGTSGGMFTASGSTITQSFNYLDLPVSDNAGNGSISIGGKLFAHTQGSPSDGSNTFLGCGAGNTDNESTQNTIVGSNAFLAVEDGSRNVVVGYNGGASWTGTESDNIYIGSVDGASGENSTIRIGNPGGGLYGQTTCYIAGVWGATAISSTQGVMIMDQDSKIAANPSGTNGQLLIGSNAGNISWANIGSADGSISITNGANSIDLSAVGSGAYISSWVDVTTTSSSMSVGVGYAANNAALVTLALPVAAAEGSQIVVTGKGVGGWLISQSASQTIFFGNLSTTAGVSGSLSSNLRRDSVTLRCVTANNEWQVESSIGNITVS